MSEPRRPVMIAGSQTTYVLRGKREITFERTYDAPIARVFATFSDPTLVPRWWGSPGAKLVVESMDMRTGGAWRFVETDAKGQRHVFRGVYRLVEPPTRIVSTFEYGMPGAPTIEETYEFVEQGKKTLLRLTSSYPDGSALGGMLSVGMDSTGGYMEGSRHQWRLDRFASILRK